MRIGPYEIQRQIAQGGMGVVYQAVDPAGKAVALKLIQMGDLHGSHLDGFLHRFHSECDALKKIDHPHVVRYLDQGEHEGQPYLVQQLIRGVRLTEWLKQHPRVPTDVAVQLGLELLDALVHVHARGVHHRDVNPNNILLVGADDPTGPHVRLIDFGFARIADGRTHTWVAWGGTKYYAAPEQAIFHPGTEEYDRYWTTPSSDVYGAAAVLFHLLVGRPPYSDERNAALDFMVTQAMIWHAKLPLWQPTDQATSLSPALRHLLAAGLAPRPEKRTAAVAAMKEALLACSEAGVAQVRVLAGEIEARRWERALRLHETLHRQYPEWLDPQRRFVEAMLEVPQITEVPPEVIAAAFSSLCALAGDAAEGPLVLRAAHAIGRTWGDAVAKSRTLAQQFQGQPGSTALGRAFLSTFQPEPALTFFDPSADASLRGLALLMLGRFAAAAAAVRVAEVTPDAEERGAELEEAPVDDLGHVVYAIASTFDSLPSALWPAYFDRPCEETVPGLRANYALARALSLADQGRLGEAQTAFISTAHALREVTPAVDPAREDLYAAWLPARRSWVHRFRRRVLDATSTPSRAVRARWLRAVDQRRRGSAPTSEDDLLLDLDIALALLLSAPPSRGPDFEAIRTMAERPGAPPRAVLRYARALLYTGDPNEALALAQRVLPSTDPAEERLWIETVGGAVLAARRAKG
jgi:serine/threonine protein kinase